MPRETTIWTTQRRRLLPWRPGFPRLSQRLTPLAGWYPMSKRDPTLDRFRLRLTGRYVLLGGKRAKGGEMLGANLAIPGGIVLFIVVIIIVVLLMRRR
jgi:hypothetical protein